MSRTNIFDQIVRLFQDSPFSFNDLLEKLHNCKDWDGTDAYVKSCLRDRIRRGKIIKVSEDSYQWNLSLEAAKPQRNIKRESQTIKDGQLAPKENYAEQTMSELENHLKGFLSSVKTRITDLMLNECTAAEILTIAIKNSISAAISGASYRTLVSSKYQKESNIKLEALVGYMLGKISLFDKEVKNNYKKWHEEVCLSIYDRFENIRMEGNYKDIDDNHCWTYGNSQKVVNLTIKYMYVLAKRLEKSKTNPLFKIVEPFLKFKEDLDIPMDRMILDALWHYNCEKEKVIIDLPYINKNNKLNKKHSDNDLILWSHWNKEIYDKVQKSCHTAFSNPIDFEIINWPKFKMIRKQSRNKRAIHKNLHQQQDVSV